MERASANRQSEYGDFQTPSRLARKVCSLLALKGIEPTAIVEPTCGAGNLLIAALDTFPQARHAFGLEINSTYANELNTRLSKTKYNCKTQVLCADFFSADWNKILEAYHGYLLVLGNPPWVTNATLGGLKSSNLPEKSNFNNHRGIDAITGRGNFDISEWMILRMLDWLNGRRGALAILCKSTVARKVLGHAWKRSFQIESAEIYKVDALRYFAAAVDACLLVCKFSPNSTSEQCLIFDEFRDHSPTSTIGFTANRLIADLKLYQRWKHLEGAEVYKWRSGIKHDCSPVLELEKRGNAFVNGLGEKIEIEETFLFPMLKSSDLANDNVAAPRRWMLVTQKQIGQDTRVIFERAPRTWRYLECHAELLNRRASTIYKGRPPYSIFGVGDYSFSDWKVAISGFYKKLRFRTIGPFEGKPTILDDTSYFIACRTENEAVYLTSLLNSSAASEFYQSFIFWDSKRPITADLLRRLNLLALAKESGSEATLKDYMTRDFGSDQLNLILG
jgi:hypothetical protein